MGPRARLGSAMGIDEEREHPKPTAALGLLRLGFPGVEIGLASAVSARGLLASAGCVGIYDGVWRKKSTPVAPM